MTVLMKRGNRKCDAQCHTARSQRCTCICGGENHGINIEQEMKKAEDTTIEDALRHMQDKEDVIFGFAKDRTVAIGGRILSPARSQAVYNHSPESGG